MVSNRIEAANSFTTGLNTAETSLGILADASAASARAWLATVGSDAASKDAPSLASTRQYQMQLRLVTVDASQTFTLTTGVDTFTGGH